MKNGTRSQQKKREAEKDLAASYEEFKNFEGRQYTGMKIGRGHKWYYDQGEWKEKKVTPDLWEFTYAVTKRRAGRAPEGSGVPVGTEYHWYIAAHQNVRKLNANDYTTSMSGFKFKVAHKRADRDNWSTSENAQRKRLAKFLRELLDSVENPAESKNALVAVPGESASDAAPTRRNGKGAATRRAAGKSARRAPLRKPAARRKKAARAAA